MAVSLVLPWIILAIGCWIGFLLVRQNGRILLRLDSLERRLGSPDHPAAGPMPAGVVPGPPSAGLPVGTLAPDFDLPDLQGGRRALSAFRGRRVLLVFFNPGCGFCTSMAPELAALPSDGAADPMPLVVTTGDVEENGRLVARFQIRGPVLVQAGMEVAAAYRVTGTPRGNLIDDAGRIASDLAAGAQALLALGQSRQDAADGPTGHRTHRGSRPLSESRILRSGLPKGAPAPDFRLPQLAGGELSLSGYRDRRPLLLVFSDRACGPCDLLAPRLAALARHKELRVLMVSRGDVEVNRRKATQHGLVFPIVLQRQWEISRLYGMFATPAAFLIGADGNIVAEPAVGVDPILTLLSRSATLAQTTDGLRHDARRLAARRQG
jgi:peroxiredoxin